MFSKKKKYLVESEIRVLMFSLWEEDRIFPNTASWLTGISEISHIFKL